MKKDERFHRFVEVQWHDAHSTNRWKSWTEADEQHDDPCLCVTVGFLVKKDKKNVSVAASIGPDAGTYGGIWTIPTPMVKKIYYLNRMEKK